MNSPRNPRWEAGSEYHWNCQPAPLLSAATTKHPWSSYSHRWGASGRDALRLILKHGIATQGWKRIWAPGFLCQEVIASIVGSSIDCQLYADIPKPGIPADLSGIPFSDGDILFLVNHFGIRAQPEQLDALRAKGIVVIEDHTHDPWSSWALASTADFCIASLRKTLPIPDGGILWSPMQRPLPDQPPLSKHRQHAALQKMAAMVLKGQYLTGAFSNKDTFRALSLQGEEAIADGEISGISSPSKEIVSHFPVETWRAQRLHNFRLACELISQCKQLTIDTPSNLPENHVPLSLRIQTSTPEQRDELKAGLVAQHIYPAVLWPLQSPVVNSIAPEEVHLSQTSLMIHIDGRYNEKDLQHIASTLVSIASNWPEQP